MKSKLLIKVTFSVILIFSILVPFSNDLTKAAKVSYLKNTKKNYTYNFYEDGKTYTETQSFIEKVKDKSSAYYGFNIWGEVGFYRFYLEKETKKGYFNNNDETAFYIPENADLVFPLNEGESWDYDNIGTHNTILSTNKTIKTPAGTFKNVVAVKVKDISEPNFNVVYYYAPNNGCIRIDHYGKKYMELAEITKR